MMMDDPFDGEGAAEDTKPIEQADAEAVSFEIPPTTAPVFPVEHMLNNSAHLFQRTIGGGMQLKFVGLATTPNGVVPFAEATVILFSAEGWERFKADVARDGVASKIETVRAFPHGMTNGKP